MRAVEQRPVSLSRVELTPPRRLLRWYFNQVYNPLYDFTIAQLSPYKRLQELCIDRLGLGAGQSVLCLGVGTGNELRLLLKRDPGRVVGVDLSPQALARLRKKVRPYGEVVRLFPMDAHHLDFTPGSFDRALCLHLMDFLADPPRATGEMMRVLQPGGRFVITYPYGYDSWALGAAVIKSALSRGWRGWARALLELGAGAGAALLYLPLALTSKPRFFSRGEIEGMFTALGVPDCQIEASPAYKDFIVSGVKGRGSGAA